MNKTEIIKTFYKQLLVHLQQSYDESKKTSGDSSYLANINANEIVSELCDSENFVSRMARYYYDTPEEYEKEYGKGALEPWNDLDAFEMELYKKYRDNNQGFMTDLIEFAEKVQQKYPNNVLCNSLLCALKYNNYEKISGSKVEIDSSIDGVIDYIALKPNIKTFIDTLDAMSDIELLDYKPNVAELSLKQKDALKKYLTDKIDEKRRGLHHASFSRERWDGESHWESGSLYAWQEKANDESYAIIDKCYEILKSIDERQENIEK